MTTKKAVWIIVNISSFEDFAVLWPEDARQSLRFKTRDAALNYVRKNKPEKESWRVIEVRTL